MGLLNQVYTDPETLYKEVEAIARQIASKSPLTVRGIKQVMNYLRDHGVEDGLRYVATWNASMLLSVDAQESMKALMSKQQPKYLD